MTGRFIVFEGLDGCGKSTTAKMLADAIGGRFMTTPSERLRVVRGEVIEALRSTVSRQAFYLATVADASETIRVLIEAGVDVVLDRYLLSTMEYAAQRGPFLAWAELEAWLLPAEVTVFMDLPLAVRQERLTKRGAGAADLESLGLEFDAGVRGRYLDSAGHRIAGQFVHLELRGSESQDEVLERVLCNMPNRGSQRTEKWLHNPRPGQEP